MGNRRPAAALERVKPGYSFFTAAREDFGKAVIAGVITAIGGYLAAIVITPDQLYWYLWLRNSNSYYGTWYGEIGGRDAKLIIDEQSLQANGRTVSIAGKLLIGATTIPVSGGADSSVTLSGKLSATTELDISLQRVQGAPRTPEEKVIKLVPQLQGQGARVCPILQNTDEISNMEACKDLGSPTYFHL